MHSLFLPEPPADELVEVLDALRFARRQLDDARRLDYMLSIDLPNPHDEPLEAHRIFVERQLAARRIELWAAALRVAEDRARVLGLDVAATL